MKNYKIIFRVIILLFMADQMSLIAQESSIETDKLEVVKAFEVQLRDAEMIDVKPVVPPVIQIKKAYNYKVSIVPLELEYPAPTIRPLAMNEENTFEKYNHLLRLSYGTINDPYGLLRLSFMDGDRYKITTAVDYYALDNSEVVDSQEMSSFNIGFNGFARINDNVICTFDLDGSQQNRVFYDTSDSIKNSQYGEKRNNQKLFFKVGLSNIDKTALDLNWDFNAIYRLDRIRNEAIGLGTGFEALIEKRRNEYINLVLPVEAEYYGTDAGDDASLFYINFEPNIHFQKGKFQSTIGADVYHDTKDHSKIWPEVELAYGIIGNYVQILAGTRQNYQFQSLSKVIEFCPWLNLDEHTSRSMLWQDYYGGIRGEFNFLSYQAVGGYRTTQNALLIKDTIVGSGRQLHQIDDNMNSVFIRGNIDFALSSTMHLGGVLTQSIYDPENQEKAWGLPETEFQAYMDWGLFKERLNLRADLIFTDRVFTQNLGMDGTLQEETLNAQFELNAQVDIRITKHFNIFGYAHNILDNKYRRWTDYPTVGINFGGGIQAKF